LSSDELLPKVVPALIAKRLMLKHYSSDDFSRSPDAV